MTCPERDLQDRVARRRRIALYAAAAAGTEVDLDLVLERAAVLRLLDGHERPDLDDDT